MKKRIFLFCIILFSSHFTCSSIEDIRFITEEYPPYNYTQNNGVVGISVDILKIITSRMGRTLTQDDIKVLPWARGYSYLSNYENTCLFSMTETDYRRMQFKWVGPIIDAEIVLLAKKSLGISTKPNFDMHGFTYGAVIDDIGEQLLLERGVDKNSIVSLSGVDTIERAFRMLNSGRIDIIAYDKRVLLWYMEKMKYDIQAYDFVFSLKKSFLYYAFSKGTSDHIITEMQHVLNQFKKEDLYKNIVYTYK